MIRAVTRYTLEINKPGSPYFERAICFVKPEYAQNERIDLHKAAQQLIASFDAGVEEREAEQKEPSPAASPEAGRCTRRQRLMRLLPLALSAIIGAGVALLFVLLIS